MLSKICGRFSRRLPVFVASLMLGLALQLGTLLAELPADGAKLALGPALELSLSSGDIRTLEASFESHRRYLLEVGQLGIDVVVEVESPGGESWLVNGPSYRQGREVFLVPAAASGTWRFLIRPAADAAGPGRIQVRLKDMTTAEPARLAAETAMTEVAGLHFEGTVEAKRKAIDRLRAALVLWRELSDEPQEGWALTSLGILSLAVGESEDAIESFLLALPLLQRSGDRAAEAIALNDLGLAYWKTGESELAGARFTEALGLQRELGNRYGAAITLNNLCLRAHSRGELRRAQECYREVLGGLRELGELRYEALVLSNLGSVNNNLGEPQLAVEFHERALALRRGTGDRSGEAQTLNNLAVVYRRLGEMQRALDHYLLGLEIRRQLDDRSSQAYILSNVAYAYLSLGEPQPAFSFLEQALALHREVGDRRGEAIALNVKAQVHSRLDQHPKAQALYRQSISLRRAVGDRRGEVSTLNRMGQSLVAAGNAAVALGFFDQALEMLESLPDRREQAVAKHFQGEAQLILGKWEEAQRNFQEALQLRQAIGDSHGEIQTLTALAETERDGGQWPEALDHVREALAKIEGLRVRVSSPDLRATFLASQRRAYELGVELYMDLQQAPHPGIHAAEPALAFDQLARQVGERARTRSLLDVLLAEGKGLSPVVSSELAKQRAELQRRLTAKAGQSLKLLSRSRETEQAELELHEVLQTLDGLEAQIGQEDQDLDFLLHPQPLDLAGTRALLEPDTLLLEYFLGTRRSFLWAITSRAFQAYELPSRSEIESAAQTVIGQLRQVDPRGRDRDLVAATNLSQMLLGPIVNEIAGRRVVVVADGVLHYLPFGALPEPSSPEDVRSKPQATPLLASHEVIHLPSASVLAAQRRKGLPQPGPDRWVAVLADPVFERGDPRVVAANPENPLLEPVARSSVSRGWELREPSLGRLPASRREASAIAALAAPGEVLLALDFDANRALALSDRLDPYRIIHFATHGVIHPQDPHQSGLVLSRFDASGKVQDGFLRLNDIFGRKLRAELVVLSGCQTALGRQIAGEGLIGITRGFMYAGVPRVVASLWRVEDQATAELMARFYRSLSVDGLTPAAALRAAQNSIRGEEKWRDPYFWGGFVIQGDWD